MKRKGFVLVGSFNQIIFVLYLTAKCKRKLDAFGPKSKLSCIGKYRRNVIDFRETAAMSLLLSFLGILDVVLTLVYTELNLDPRAVFYIDSFIWIFLFGLFSLACSIFLSSRPLPFTSEPLPRPLFYVIPPSVLEPRRPPQPLSPILLPRVRFRGKIRRENRGQERDKVQPGSRRQLHHLSCEHKSSLSSVQ